MFPGGFAPIVIPFDNFWRDASVAQTLLLRLTCSSVQVPQYFSILSLSPHGVPAFSMRCQKRLVSPDLLCSSSWLHATPNRIPSSMVVGSCGSEGHEAGLCSRVERGGLDDYIVLHCLHSRTYLDPTSVRTSRNTNSYPQGSFPQVYL